MSAAASKRKRTDTTLEGKLKIIDDRDSGMSFSAVALKHGIGKTTAQYIYKQREAIRKLNEENQDLSGHHIKSHLDEAHLKLDRLSWEWFSVMRSKLVPISGPLIKEKAAFFAKELNILDFKASDGWLTKWKDRHNISAHVISGESAVVDQTTVTDFRSRIPTLTVEYSPENIFNADETGLFFRALPDKSLVARGDECKGGKMAKERLTVLFCASQTGEKIKPFVIGKSENPRCFKNVKKEKLPVQWRANKKAWMTGILFDDFLTGLNNQMRRQKRKILLFIDNAPSHPPDVQYSNVVIKYFPPNTTSHLQPLDQGIIRAFKAHYRRCILQNLLCKLDEIESVFELTSQVTVLDAVHWIDEAWRCLSVSTIQHCFAKAGFRFLETNDIEFVDDDDTMNGTNIFDIMQRFFDKVPSSVAIPVNDYLTFDDGITSADNRGNTADEIAVEIWQQHQRELMAEENADQESEDEVEIVSEEAPQPVTDKEAMHMLTSLKGYFMQNHSHLFKDVFMLESSFYSSLVDQKLKNAQQSTLERFFAKESQ